MQAHLSQTTGAGENILTWETVLTHNFVYLRYRYSLDQITCFYRLHIEKTRLSKSFCFATRVYFTV